MTRGGARKGAGRPPTKGEKRTTHLGGVHVTPTQLESFRRAAWVANMTISEWVVYQLDKAVAGVADLIAVAYEEKPKHKRKKS